MRESNAIGVAFKPPPTPAKEGSPICLQAHSPFLWEGRGGFTSFGVAFSLASQAGLPHFVRQPCPVNNETAIRFVDGEPHTPLRHSPINDETAVRFVDKKRYVLPYALPSKVGSALLCRTTFMVQIAYLWCTTSLIRFC